jgi:hypothetical protein
MELTRNQLILSWVLRLVAAVILLQPLFFPGVRLSRSHKLQKNRVCCIFSLPLYGKE